MDKVKTTYRVEGHTVRLTDPNHFYRWLEQRPERQSVSTSLESAVRIYRAQFPDRCAVHDP